MTDQLQTILAATRTLSMREKLELLQAISQDLQKTYSLAEDSAAFWSPRSIEELVEAQSVPVITDVHTLAVDFWPEDESADDLNEFIAAQRRADRSNGA